MDEKGDEGIGMEDDAPEEVVADRPKSVLSDRPEARVSIKEKLEAMKQKISGGMAEKDVPQKAKGKEETL